jgi:branched-subunit amino acid transport protein
MSNTVTLIVVIAALGAGTYGMRLGGALVAHRVRRTTPGQPGRLGSTVGRLLPYAAVALLAALAATAAVTEAGRFTGVSRPAGVAAGFLAGWLKAPFPVALICGAAVAAGLRLLGVP